MVACQYIISLVQQNKSKIQEKKTSTHNGVKVESLHRRKSWNLEKKKKGKLGEKENKRKLARRRFLSDTMPNSGLEKKRKARNKKKLYLCLMNCNIEYQEFISISDFFQ